MLSFQLNEIITPIALGLHVSDTIFFHMTVKIYKMGPIFGIFFLIVSFY